MATFETTEVRVDSIQAVKEQLVLKPVIFRTANTSALPPLNAAQLTKLKMLTLVDLAGKSRSLPYCTHPDSV